MDFHDYYDLDEARSGPFYTPWTPETDMTGVTVSAWDFRRGSPKAGDMIGYGDDEMPHETWLVSAEDYNVGRHFRALCRPEEPDVASDRSDYAH